MSHTGNTPAPRAAAAHSSLFTCSGTREPGPTEADAPSLLPGSPKGRGPTGRRCFLQEGPNSPGIALNVGKKKGGCPGWVMLCLGEDGARIVGTTSSAQAMRLHSRVGISSTFPLC